MRFTDQICTCTLTLTLTLSLSIIIFVIKTIHISLDASLDINILLLVLARELSRSIYLSIMITIIIILYNPTEVLSINHRNGALCNMIHARMLVGFRQTNIKMSTSKLYRLLVYIFQISNL